MDHHCASPRTVRELIDRFLAWADAYYRHAPDPSTARRHPTGHLKNFRDALRWVPAEVLDRPPTAMSAECLMLVRDRLLEHRRRSGLPPTRSYVARVPKMIRFIFAWAARPPRRWVPVEVLIDLGNIERLRPGRSSARESSPVEPVSVEQIEATLAAIRRDLSRARSPRQAMALRRLAVLVIAHWSTGMRPGELVGLRLGELRFEGGVAVYRPHRHKCAHHGITRSIVIGPATARLLDEWSRVAALHKADRLFGRLTVNGYYQAVARICRRHNIEHWSPNRMRHAFAQRARTDGGLDVAQYLLGHQHRSTTEIYTRPVGAQAIDAVKRLEQPSGRSRSWIDPPARNSMSASRSWSPTVTASRGASASRSRK